MIQTTGYPMLLPKTKNSPLKIQALENSLEILILENPISPNGGKQNSFEKTYLQHWKGHGQKASWTF